MTASNEELLALADEFDAGTAKALASGYMEFDENFVREREMISSALRHAAQSGGEVRVKPLEWLACADGTHHDTGCQYEVEHLGKSWRAIRAVTCGGSYICDADTIELAKAAAQADYEQRIRSALVHPTPAPSGNEALRKATIAECIRELQTSYPDHAWLNAACAALRQLADAALSTPAPAQQAVDVEAVKRAQPAIDNLINHQEQCDQDGVMVKVSRQALDEVLALINGGRDAEVKS
jgi:hypothetical protein